MRAHSQGLNAKNASPAPQRLQSHAWDPPSLNPSSKGTEVTTTPTAALLLRITIKGLSPATEEGAPGQTSVYLEKYYIYIVFL